ncbi:MAG: dihydroorotate dehydrogenase [candidate division WOR-3 bacterium]
MTRSVTIGRTTFANPVLAASGTFGFGLQFPLVANRLGGVVTKGITLEPRPGNPPPRVYEFPGGIINSVGLENPGLQAFRAQVLPRLGKLKCRVVVNVAGFTVDEYRELVLGLDHERVDAIELNVSCPNVNEGGVAFGQSPRLVEEITRFARRATGKTLIVKLTANFVDPAETARAAESAGADAVTAINTLFGMALDEWGRPFLGGRTGGISGPALKPFALYCVDRVSRAVKIPVIGCGGIMCGRDAQDFLCAGAQMVQVGTASLVNPRAALEIVSELAGKRRRK